MREWSCLGTTFLTQEAFVSHANAALTPRARLRLAKLIVEDDWPVSRRGEDVHDLAADGAQVGGEASDRRVRGDV
ncbi:hypothetical protein GCM10025789_30560 [Tessaracoccus lubricantis]|uniref:DUF222 domain-containing protein n=1 Tax=Tessaracoccus lubricantis TaxID=545543 RepID=A0ABP9FNH9_9ACTN